MSSEVEGASTIDVTRLSELRRGDVNDRSIILLWRDHKDPKRRNDGSLDCVVRR